MSQQTQQAQTELQSPDKGRRRDLTCYPLVGLTWSADKCEESLNKVFEHVRRDAIEAVQWYSMARKPKRRLATSARLLAVLLLGVAALLPMVEGILLAEVQPIWISLAIAAAAGAIGLDRALGSTSGWIRCIKTELQLRDALEKFELDWECARADWRGACPEAEQTTAMLQTAKQFAEHINIIVQEETNAWVDEFQSTINQIEEKLRTRREAARAADINNSDKGSDSKAARQENRAARMVAAGFQPHEWQDSKEEGVL